MRISDWSSDVCSSDLSRSGDARWQDLTPAGTNVTAFSISADGSTMALVQGDANTPSDVYLLDLRHPRAAPQRLTRFGDAVHEVYAVSQVEAVRWRSADDRFDIDGWLVKPADYQPDRKRTRSAERRVGKECGSTCESRWVRI